MFKWIYFNYIPWHAQLDAYMSKDEYDDSKLSVRIPV